METANEYDKRDSSPWHPIKDAIDLKHLGKFAEELSECGAIVARCIIQGIDKSEPTTGKPNIISIQEEIADVLANAELVMERLGLDTAAIAKRKKFKKERLQIWHYKA